jgi:hypothetical protein
MDVTWVRGHKVQITASVGTQCKRRTLFSAHSSSSSSIGKDNMEGNKERIQNFGLQWVPGEIFKEINRPRINDRINNDK